MKKISGKILAVFEKIPVVAYALISFIQSLVISVLTIIALFLSLWATGVYAKLVTALDLKYNSPIILAPIWAFSALFLVCLVVGFLMYFHKYKRRKTGTDFYKAIAPALGKK